MAEHRVSQLPAVPAASKYCSFSYMLFLLLPSYKLSRYHEFPMAVVTNYYQNRGLKCQKFIVTVLEASNLTSRCWQCHILSEVSKSESFLVFSGFWWLLAFLVLWRHHSSLCFHSHTAFSSCVCSHLFLCLAFSGTSMTAGRPHLDGARWGPQLKIFNFITSAMTTPPCTLGLFLNIR